jgi:hypothetical protein
MTIFANTFARTAICALAAIMLSGLTLTAAVTAVEAAPAAHTA